MEEYGRVVDIKDGKGFVVVEKKSGGRNCSCCNMCRRGAGGEPFLEAAGYEGMQKGDRVRIEINETAVLKGVFFLYGIPLAGFFLAVGLVRLVTPLYLKTAIFLIVCIFAWLAGLAKGNAEGKRNGARIVKL
ncbi:MAG TPA: SoxR reducing system RseC family protein [bacterium]|jgi:positive regulator of sigma E activity|nr:SoxR reducing system RseC family protein [bacterium]